MSEFTIRSESVDVDQIMKQIRARILEKRGADYTEDQIRELATVRLEKFLDPKNLRSDLLEQFRKSRPAIVPPPLDEPPTVEAPYTFDDQTLFTSHRGPMRLVRSLLRPLLKLFFNPNTLNQILHTQAQFNVDLLKREARRRIEFGQRMHQFDQSRSEWNMLYYEVLHNIVLETTRIGIEVQNLRMRVESLSSRLDFSERRVRALEGVVQYRPEAVRPPERRQPDELAAAPIASAAGSSGSEGYVPTNAPAGPGGASGGAAGDAGRRKRRRRRGRRGGGPFGPGETGGAGQASGGGEAGGSPGAPEDAGGADEPFDDDTETFDGGDDTPNGDAGADSGAMDEPNEPSDDKGQ